MEITDDDVMRHQAWLAQQINENRSGEKTTCDLTLISENNEFQVHKAVMMVVSKYFEKMFTIEMKEKYSDRVEIKQIPHQRLRNIIEFIYGGRIDINEDNVTDILDDAEYLELQALKSQCIKYFLASVSAENVFKFRAFAQQWDFDEVLAKTSETIMANFAKVIEHEDFMQLDVDNMSDVIKQRNKGCARSEEACFTGIIQWVNHSPLEREKLFVRLFLEVDLPATSMEFLEMISQENLVKNNLSCVNVLVQGCLKFNQRMSTSTILLIGGKLSENKAFAYDIMTKRTKDFPNLNTGRWGASSVKVGSKVFIIGGARTSTGKNPHKSCEMVDLNEQTTWMFLPDMFEARERCGSAFIAGEIHVTGGRNVESLSSCEKFDITANMWIKTENMLQKRHCHGCVACNDLLYCIGGRNDTKRLASCEHYDVKSQKWKKIAPLNQPRSSLSCVLLDGMIYAIGGIGTKVQALTTVERYVPEANTWENVASLLIPCYGSSACVIGTKLYVIGGGGGDKLTEATKAVQVYDPASDSWSSFETKNTVSGATVVVI